MFRNRNSNQKKKKLSEIIPPPSDPKVYNNNGAPTQSPSPPPPQPYTTTTSTEYCSPSALSPSHERSSSSSNSNNRYGVVRSLLGYRINPIPYGSPFAILFPFANLPFTEQIINTWFQLADQRSRGFIDDKELQIFLSTDNRIFSIRTVHLLMYDITNTNTRKLGFKEFSALVHSMMNWKEIFERVDRNGSLDIDSSELQEALLTLGCTVPPVILDLLVSNFAESGGSEKTIEYDSFIGCCLTVKRLHEKLREKDTNHNGSATFTCESFISTVLYLL